MSMAPVEFGIVAAMEREVPGLVQGWSTVSMRIADVPRTIYCAEGAVLVCAGAGVVRACAAAKALVEEFSPKVLISIGFAGSCVSDLHPGSVVVPATVLEAATGTIFPCVFGQGKVVTLDRVAGEALKQEASARFGALAVDMEAAGVAAAAIECDTRFVAIKVISDDVKEDIGFLSPFVKPEGFEIGRFMLHIALRPALWPRVMALQRDSKLASAALERAVLECISDWRTFSVKHTPAAATSLTKESF